MIVVDYNQTAISSLMAELASHKSVEIRIDLVRHIIINALRSYKNKFSSEYGQMIIACDNRYYWRKTIFPYYKAGRKKTRDNSIFDWHSIFDALNLIRDEIEEHFPYPVLNVEGAEADDIIATLAEYAQTSGLGGQPEPFLILSGDHDFQQLQKWSNVKQYSPIQKLWLTIDDDPSYVLMEHIVRGDKGDGIPNILSADDIFITKGRQKALKTELVNAWRTQRPEMFITTPELQRNYERNKNLIDLSCVPGEIKTAILDCYHHTPSKSPSQLMAYFMQHRMKNMLDVITEF
jgi:hypothetical protein